MPYRYVDLEGLASHVRHSGPTVLPPAPPELGDGAPLILLHDVAGNQAVFDGLIEALPGSRGWVAFDMPAHGRSGALDSLASIDEMARFARSLVRALGVERPVLVGHGMGGAVALEYARLHADELRAVVALGCGAQAPDRSDTIAQVRRVTQGKERRAFVRALYAPETKPDIMQRGFREMLKTDPRAELGDWLALAAWSGVTAANELALPVLLVHGAHDDAALCDEVLRLEASLPNASRSAIENAGHQLPLEQPEALAAELDAFLESLA